MWFDANVSYHIIIRTRSLNIKKLDVSWSSSDEFGMAINDNFLRGLTYDLSKKLVVLNIRGK